MANVSILFHGLIRPERNSYAQQVTFFIRILGPGGSDDLEWERPT
jgi:hypothetical protein